MCASIQDMVGVVESRFFGLADPKPEGSPRNPDDMLWEHPPASGCEICELRYDRQLKAYKEYWEKVNNNSSS